MKKILVALTVVLVGCSQIEYMSIEEYKERVEYCESLDMNYYAWSGWNNRVSQVMCIDGGGNRWESRVKDVK